MVLNFLTEIALQAFRTDKGIHPATTPATCQENYSGDLKSTATNNKGPITLPPQKLPFSWPDLNPNNKRPLPNKQNQPPGPANTATDPEQSKKRPNKCWTFGDHYSDACNKPPVQCPADFKSIQKNAKKTHTAACSRFFEKPVLNYGHLKKFNWPENPYVFP